MSFCYLSQGSNLALVHDERGQVDLKHLSPFINDLQSTELLSRANNLYCDRASKGAAIIELTSDNHADIPRF